MSRGHKARRRRVFHRDGPVCYYCGEHADTVDHLIPKSRGGAHTKQNLVACCSPCNSVKSHIWPAMVFKRFVSLYGRPSPKYYAGTNKARLVKMHRIWTIWQSQRYGNSIVFLNNIRRKWPDDYQRLLKRFLISAKSRKQLSGVSKSHVDA